MLFWILALVIPKLAIISLVMITALGTVEAAEEAVVSLLLRDSENSSDGSSDTLGLDDEVLRWRPVVEYWANQYGIPDWTMELLAIMNVESGGRSPDLMQSSESAGLPINTLEYEDSIAQGVRYLAQIITRGRSFGIEDRLAIFQAYNFGIFYINFLAQRSIPHTLEISAYYSRTVVAPSLGNTVGQRYSYPNPIAIANEKPWLYVNGGNFHYAFIVQYTLERAIAIRGDDAFFLDGVAFPLEPPFHITSTFGPRWGRYHNGIDLSVRFGAPVRAVMDGTVIRVDHWFESNDGHRGHPNPWGNVVVIEHANGIVTIYAHLMQEINVQVGDIVVAGQHIGFQGNSGYSTGTHLHFEWRENGVSIDPELRINFREGAH